MLLSVILLVVLIGAGVTIALSVASTDPVVNTFQAGKIDTEIKEEFPGDALSKTVTVTNSSEAKSDAFVRVRINAPEGFTLDLTEATGENATWEKGDDGFYYYLYSVEPDGSTTALLKGFQITDQSLENFDITVYHESCIATVESHQGDGGAISLKTIQDAFKKATGTEHQD